MPGTPEELLQKRLRELAREGLSLRDMASRLEAEGLTTAAGASAWHHHGVARLLARWGIERGERDVEEVRLELPAETARWLKTRGGRTWLRRAVMKAHAEQVQQPAPRAAREKAESGPYLRKKARLLGRLSKAHQHAKAVDSIRSRLRARFLDENPGHFALAELHKLRDDNERTILMLERLQDELKKDRAFTGVPDAGTCS